MTTHILIVDDDVDALKLVGLMLEPKGYEIQAAKSGEQALHRISKMTPDLIILDVMMPEMDGYELAKRLRDQPGTREIPILFFTAMNDISDKIAGFEAGGDDYLTKPIHPAELLSRVEALLKRGGRRDAEEEQGKIITFLPAKGGVGNSTLALNAAILLSEKQEEKKTLLIEYQDGGGTLAMQMGSKSSLGLRNLVQETNSLTSEKLETQLLRHSASLYILPASSKPAGTAPPITEDFTEMLLYLAVGGYDYVLFDLPPRLGATTNPILQRAAYILATFEPNPITLKLTKAILEELEALHIGDYKIKLEVMYRAPSASAVKRATIEQELGFDMLGSIPPAPDLAYESWNTGRPMVSIQSMSLISQQVKMVVDDILSSL